jgi:hypothetical protein
MYCASHRERPSVSGVAVKWVFREQTKFCKILQAQSEKMKIQMIKINSEVDAVSACFPSQIQMLIGCCDR